MTNLKINSTSTPYWCVVVPVEADDIRIYNEDGINSLCYWHGKDGWLWHEDKLPAGDWDILGCITSSGMDEGVREVVDENEWLYDPNVDAENEVKCYRDFADGNKWWQDAHESALSLLTHNQITLTADQKAVVVKQKL